MVQMGKKETLWETCLANNVFLAGPVSSIQLCVYVRVRCAQIYVYALCMERKQTLWERCLATMYSKRVLFIDTILFLCMCQMGLAALFIVQYSFVTFIQYKISAYNACPRVCHFPSRITN